jgi:hypothetical protein
MSGEIQAMLWGMATSLSSLSSSISWWFIEDGSSNSVLCLRVDAADATVREINFRKAISLHINQLSSLNFSSSCSSWP